MEFLRSRERENSLIVAKASKSDANVKGGSPANSGGNLKNVIGMSNGRMNVGSCLNTLGFIVSKISR